MPIDAYLGIGVALAALAAGEMSLPGARGGGKAGRMAAVTAGTGLLAVTCGLGWQAWRDGVWPGGTAAQALLMLAGAALGWWLWPANRHKRFASAALLLGAAAAGIGGGASAWLTPVQAPAAQGGNWLFGVRSLLAAIGSAGWLLVLAGSTTGLCRAAGPRPETGEGDHPEHAALRMVYPWLSAALLAGGVWSLAAYAVPWRGAPAELWLAIAWLVGAMYLHTPSEAPPPEAPPSTAQRPRLGAWPLTALAAAGLLAAVLSAALAASLLG